MIAVAKAYPVSSETSAAELNGIDLNQRGSRNGSGRPNPRSTPARIAATPNATSAPTMSDGSASMPATRSLPASVSPTRIPTRPTENIAAPSRSSRPDVRIASQRGGAAHAVTSRTIAIGTFR